MPLYLWPIPLFLLRLVSLMYVANLIDMPGAASNAARSSSFSKFANRGPANQVGGQVRLQPTGLVAEEIEEEEVQSLETKSQVTPLLSETTTLLDTQHSTPVCVGSKLDAVVEDDAEEDMCDFNARLACLRDASCSGCKFCQRPEEQHPCNAYDVNVCPSDVFAVTELRRRIRDRCVANMIQLANDDNFMAALHIQISELELDLYESQKQVNRLVYATYNQIWEMKETREIDEINLQNDKMQIDRIILDVDCNTPDCFNLPQRPSSNQIQRMPSIKGSEIGGSWGIRLLTKTSTPFSKQNKTQAKKVVHLSDHPAVCLAVKGRCVLKRMFGTARVIWAMLMLTLFDAAGVLVPAPQLPKIFRPGRTVRNVIFFALLVIALFLSYSLIIEQSAFMAITAIGSAAIWVTPLQIAHGAIGIHSAGERSINQVMDHACEAIFVKSRFEYKRACIMPSPASGYVPLLSMTKTCMMAKINDQNRSEALFMCMHMNFDDHGQSRISMLDSGCNNIMMPLGGEINAKVVDFDRNGSITGEGVQQSFTTEASGTLGITVPCTAPDGSHFKFDMLADGVQFFPAATSMMSQTLSPITWVLRAGCDAIFTGRSS